MKRKIFSVLVAFAFVVSIISFVNANNNAKSSNELAVLLPSSDMVLTLDSDRFLNQALPQILSSNESVLTNINDEIAKIKTKTGLDLREFRQVAVGVKTVEISKGKTSFQPVFLARGTVTAETLVSVVKLASNGKYKTETINGRTVYIFSPKEIVEANKDKVKSGNSIFDKLAKNMSSSLSKEIAMSAYDSNTIAFGLPNRVRATVGNTPRISNDVLGLLNRKPNSIINMGAKTPYGLSQFMPMDNDELGKDLDSIRQIQGSMNVENDNTLVSLLAKTEQTSQAESLEANLKALQMVFSRILLGMKGEDKKVYGRTLSNMEIMRQTDEISIDMSIPQSDIDKIIGKK